MNDDMKDALRNAFDVRDQLAIERDIDNATKDVQAQVQQMLTTPNFAQTAAVQNPLTFHVDPGMLEAAEKGLAAHRAAEKEFERQKALTQMRYDAMRRFRRSPNATNFIDIMKGWVTTNNLEQRVLFDLVVETLRPQGLPRDGPFVWCSREDRTVNLDPTGEIKVALQSILTPPGVGSFLNLQTPRAVVVGGEPRYSLTIIFDKTQQARPEFKQLQEGIDAALKEKWPARLPVGLKSPFHDAAEKAGVYEGYKPGDIFISPWSKNQPGCINARKEDIIDFSEFYAGWLVRAKVRPFAYDQGGNKGCSFFLDHVQFLKPGKRLDGRKPASESFPDDAEGEDEMV